MCVCSCVFIIARDNTSSRTCLLVIIKLSLDHILCYYNKVLIVVITNMHKLPPVGGNCTQEVVVPLWFRGENLVTNHRKGEWSLLSLYTVWSFLLSVFQNLSIKICRHHLFTDIRKLIFLLLYPKCPYINYIQIMYSTFLIKVWIFVPEDEKYGKENFAFNVL